MRDFCPSLNSHHPTNLFPLALKFRLQVDAKIICRWLFSRSKFRLENGLPKRYRFQPTFGSNLFCISFPCHRQGSTNRRRILALEAKDYEVLKKLGDSRNRVDSLPPIKRHMPKGVEKHFARHRQA